MGASIYASVQAAEAASEIDRLRDQAIQWKARANRFREADKVRFCEVRMMFYKHQLDTALADQLDTALADQ